MYIIYCEIHVRTHPATMLELRPDPEKTTFEIKHVTFIILIGLAVLIILCEIILITIISINRMYIH